ncbi:putative NAD-specific glutamate dehydrogenase encoded in antisensegene pair with dnaKJ [Oceanicaulis sp. HTCC2633]|nr:putative NAD-specific glutamate dehydrogenase encoded in antisensegene pair with dnaKJ [Oceanicaulis sp. HTCC2633]
MDRFRVFTLLDAFQLLDRILDRGLVLGRHLVAELLDLFLGLVDQRFSIVLRIHELTALLVRVGVRLGVLDHLLDIAVGQTARGLDADRLFLAGGLVLGGHVHKAVGVDIEGHLDLRHAARGRRNAHKVELTQQLVVRRHFALALEDPDRHSGLIVVRGGEGLGLLGRDGRVAVDETGEHAAQGLDAEAQRGHVQQQHVLHIALQNAGLDGGAHGDHFIRVHALVRVATEEAFHRFLDLGHAGHAAHQHHIVDFGRRNARILERVLARLDGALDQVVHQAFQLGAGELHVEVFRTGGVGGDEGQVHFIGRGGRQLFLGLLRFLFQTLQGQLVLAQVDRGFLFELVCEVFDDTHVEIFAAQEGIAIGGFHFKDAIADFQHGHVEGAAAEVVDDDGAVIALVEAVCERSRGRLVDDAQNFQTRDLARILGRLALGVIEIGRHGDDGFFNFRTQIALGGFLHFLKDEGGNLARRVLLVAALHPGVAIGALGDGVGHHVHVFLHGRIAHGPADQALDGEKGVVRVGHGLALGGLADQALAVFREGDHGRGGPHALCVLDHFRLVTVHDGDAGVGGPKVDPDNFAHRVRLSCLAAGRGGGEKPEALPSRREPPPYWLAFKISTIWSSSDCSRTHSIVFTFTTL